MHELNRTPAGKKFDVLKVWSAGKFPPNGNVLIPQSSLTSRPLSTWLLISILLTHSGEKDVWREKEDFFGGDLFQLMLVMQTEGRLWGPRDAFSSHVFVFAFYIYWHNQHHTPCEPWYACMHFLKKLFHGFDVSYCWLSSDVFSCFILCCFPFVFSKVKQSWVVLIWYFTCQVVVTFFQCCLTVASCHFGNKYFLKLTWHNAPTHPSIMYWKPQKAYNLREVTREELCLSGYYSISNSTSATRHHILWWL